MWGQGGDGQRAVGQSRETAGWSQRLKYITGPDSAWQHHGAGGWQGWAAPAGCGGRVAGGGGGCEAMKTGGEWLWGARGPSGWPL